MKPTFYHNDRLRLGTLSGQHNAVNNPVRRVADGSITLPYLATSGTTPTGAIETRIASGFADPQNPTHLVIPRAAATLSGYRILVHSEDLDGSNQDVRLDVTSTSGESAVYTLSGGTARRVWRITFSGVSGQALLQTYEIMLADEYQAARPPLVGVDRIRGRQYTRIPIQGSQAFVKREGPRLRRTRYTIPLISGTEIDGLRSFIDSIEGGNPFFHIDDLGDQYFAEMMGEGADEADEAGVYEVDITVQEIKVD